MSGAFKPVTFLILVFATVVVLAEDYDVGDDTQWKRPTDLEFYTTWAAGKTFHVGDELEFEFDHERHDVAIVTQDAYENCIKDKPIKVITTSPAKIKLTTTGPQYFICSMADHCRWGQKLEINVVGAGGAATPAKGGAAGGATPGPSAGGGSTPAPGAGPSAGGGTTEAPGAGPSAGGSIPPTTPSETTPSGSGETTKPSGSGETSTTTTPPAESAASSLGGATFLATFVSAVIALF